MAQQITKGAPRGASTFVNPFAVELPSLIGEREFCEVYSAAEFAREWSLYLDTMVTITWPMLGLVDEAAVAAGWLAFRKCLTAWMSERDLPTAYAYAHERGRKRGLHSHVAVFVPGVEIHPGLRRDFRSWVLAWAKRTAGRRVPKSTRVRDDGGRRSLIYHWRHISYICKTFDKSVVVVSGNAMEDGLPVYLGDLIAWEWQDPGHVQMKRVGVSQSLGPARRVLGYPECAAWDCEVPTVDLDVSAVRKVPVKRAFRYGPLPGSLAHTICAPWLSPYECGVRTKEGLYPAEFIEVVEVGYPSAKELRFRAVAAARAVQQEVDDDFLPSGFSIL